jgi:hypothetical protein
MLSVAYKVVGNQDHFDCFFQLPFDTIVDTAVSLDFRFLPNSFLALFPSTFSCQRATRTEVPLLSTTYDGRWLHLLYFKGFLLFFLVILPKRYLQASFKSPY